MKTMSKILLLLVILRFTSTAYSQTFSCSDFSVTNTFPKMVTQSDLIDHGISIQYYAEIDQFVSVPLDHQYRRTLETNH